MAAMPQRGAGLDLQSDAFEHGRPIPVRHTADGSDVSPPLRWRGLPEGTASLALICEDPDAPRGTWVHWVLYDLPPTVASLSEGIAALESTPEGATHGRNDFGRLGYGGPAPPSGTHRYFFRLFALDRRLGLAPGATAQALRRAMDGHILAEAERMGTYSRR